MKPRKRLSRVMALLLSFAMIISMAPYNWLPIYAEDGDEPPTETAQVVDETANDPEPAAEDTTTKAEESVEEAPQTQEQPQQEAAPPQDEESEVDADAAVPADEEAAEDVAAPDSKEAEESVPDEATDENAKDAEYPAFVKSETVDGVKVTVKAKKGILPEGTSLVVRPVSTKKAEAMGQEALGEDVTIEDAIAVDISFERIVDGKTVAVQPEDENAVQVTLKLTEALEGNNFVVLHENHDGEVEKIDADATAKKVTFDGNEFSVYAVVATGYPEGTFYRTYHFYRNEGDTEPLYSEAVKPGETLADPPKIPGLQENQGLRGWYKSGKSAADARDFEDYKTEWSAVSTLTADEEVSLYANIVTTHSVTYKDEEGHILTTVAVEEGTDCPIARGYTPHTSDKTFGGWVLDGDTGGQLYTTEDVLSNVIEDHTLTPSLTQAYILHFIENDGAGGAAYAPPVTLSEGADIGPYLPGADKMIRPGYTFDGWYHGSGEDGTATLTGERVTGGAITEETWLYAKWIPATTKVSVLVWKQSLDDRYDATEMTYDFDASRSSVNVDIASETVINDSTVITDGKTIGDYKTLFPASIGDGFTYSRMEIKNPHQYVTDGVSGVGNTTINIYYDREEWSVTFRSKVSNPDRSKTYWSLTGNTSGSWFQVQYSNGYWRRISDGSASYSTYDKYEDDRIFVGLYGQPFSKYGYTWPSGRWKSISFVGAFSGDLFGASGLGGQPGKILTYTDTATANLKVHYWVQDARDDGEVSYTEKGTVDYTINSDQRFNIANRFSGTAFAGYNWTTSASQPSTWKTNTYNDTYTGDTKGSNTHLHIKFDLNINDIVFNINGNTNASDTISNVPYGLSLSGYEDDAPSVTAPNGYKFTGWYKDEACTIPFDWNSTMPDGDVVIYAGLKQNRYRVVLNMCDNGEGSWTSGAGSFLVQQGQAPGFGVYNWPHHALVGWYLDADYTQPYTPAAMYDNTEGVDPGYYQSAAWYAGTYLRPGEKDSTGATMTQEAPDAAGLLQLYAKWRELGKVTLIYDANGGSNPPTDTSDYADQAYAAAKAGCTPPEGETFKCWSYEAADGSGTVYVYPGYLFDIRMAKATEDANNAGSDDKTITLKAVYGKADMINPVDVTYHANASGVTPSEKTVQYSRNVRFNVPTGSEIGYERNGYAMIGWSKTASATTPDTGFGVGDGKLAADETLPNDLYAVWEYEKTLNFASNNAALGSVDKTEAKVSALIDSVTVTATAVDGQRFVNWTKDGNEVSTNATLTLNKPSGGWTDANYVANFEHVHHWTYSCASVFGWDPIVATCDNPGHSGGTVELSLNGTNATYDGNPHGVTINGLNEFNAATGKSVSASDIVYYKLSDTDTPLEGAPTEAGRYHARITVEGITTKANFNINPKGVPTAAESVTPTSFNYNKEKQVPNLTIKDSELGGYQLVEGKDYEVRYFPVINGTPDTSSPVAEPTDAGTYQIEYIGTGNYSGSVRAYMFTINKVDPTYSVTATNPTYNGQPQPLVTGTCDGGTISYRLNTVYEFSGNVPEGTDAKTYEVLYYITGDKNHNNIGSSDTHYDIEVHSIIAPKPVTITAEQANISKDFGDADPELKVALTVDDNGIIEGDTVNATLTRTPGEDMGTYAYTGAASSNPNYIITVASDAVFTVKGRDVSDEATVTGVNNTYIYNGRDQKPTPTVTIPDPSDSTKTVELIPGTDYDLTYVDKNGNTVAAPGPVNAGGYKVVITFKGNYSGSKGVPFTIEPASLSTATVTLSPEGGTYTGSGQSTTPTVTLIGVTPNTVPADSYTVSYKKKNEETGTFEDITGEPKDAGEYQVVITAKDGTNFKDSVTAATTFKIEKADASVTTAPTAKTGLTYSGNPQALVNAGSSSDGTMKYGFSQNGPWSEDIPVGTAAGDYKVYYYVEGDANHSDSAAAGPVKVTIGSKAIDTEGEDANAEASLSETSYTYDGEVKKPTVTVKADETTLTENTDFTVAYYKADDVNADGTIKEGAEPVDPKNVGSYKAVVTYQGNYSGTTVLEYSIGKAAPEVNAPTAKTGLTYSGNPQALVNAGSSSDGTMKYGFSQNGPWSEDIPVGTAAGDYKVYYYVEGNANHSDSAAAGPVEVTIGPKAVDTTEETEDPSDDLTAEGVDETCTYTGSPVKPEPEVKVGDTELEKGTDYDLTYVDKNGNTVAAPGPVNAGDYKVVITFKGNYSGSKEIPYTIAPKSLTADDVDAIYGTTEFTYAKDTPQGPTPTVTDNGLAAEDKALTADTDYTVKYYKKGEGDRWTELSGKPTDAGEYKVEVTGTGNYKDTVSQAFEIEKATATDFTDAVPTATNPTYTPETAQALVTAPNADKVPEGYTVKYRITSPEGAATGWSEDVPQAIDAGTYTIEYMYEGDSNHNDVTPENNSFTATINKAEPGVTAPTAKTGLTYSGEPQTLVTEGSAVTGTVYYRLGDSGNWTTTPPAATDQGSYTIYYYVKGNGNYNDKGSESEPLGSVSATISAKEISEEGDITATGIDPTVTYDGTAKTPAPTAVTVPDPADPTKTVTLTEGTDYDVTYIDKDGNAVAAPGPVDAGDYKAVITLKGNYSGSKDVPFTIEPASLRAATATLSPESGTYTGSGQSTTPTVTLTGVTPNTVPADSYMVSYKKKNEETGTFEDITGEPKDAGEYQVVITAKDGTNFKDSVTVATTFEIKKADQATPDAPVADSEKPDAIVITNAIAGVTYTIRDIADNVIAEVTATQDGTLTITNEDAEEGQEIKPGTTYSVEAQRKGDDNHNPSAVSGPTEVTTPPAALGDDVVTTPTTLTINDPDENTKYEVQDEDGNTVATVTVDKDGNILEPAETADGVKVEQDEDGNIVVSGLEPEKDYTVTATKTDDEGNTISNSSAPTTVTTPELIAEDTPDAPDATSKSDGSVEIKPAENGTKYIFKDEDGNETTITVGDDGTVTVEPGDGDVTAELLETGALMVEGLAADTIYDVTAVKTSTSPDNKDSEPSEPVKVKTAKEAPTTPEQDKLVGEAGNDGSIKGVDDTMEYKDPKTGEWKPVTGDTIENLEPGDCEVRYAAVPEEKNADGTVKTPEQPASEVKTVTVNKKVDDQTAVEDIKTDATTDTITVTEPVKSEEDPTVYEYSIDGGETWQTSPTFEGLEPGTTYPVSVRKAETDESMPSPATTVDVTTDPAAPADIDVTPTTLTINDPDENTQYEVKDEDGNTVATVTVDKDGNIVEPAETADGVTVEQDEDGNIVVSGLEPEKDYTVTATKTDDEGTPISDPSEPATVTTPELIAEDTPDKPDATSKSDGSVEIKPAENGTKYIFKDEDGNETTITVGDDGTVTVEPGDGDVTAELLETGALMVEGLASDAIYEVTAVKTPTSPDNKDSEPSEPVKVKTAKEAPTTPEQDKLVGEAGNDGSIKGVDDTMEYKDPKTGEWKPVTGDTIENLEPGDYEVRYAAVPEEKNADGTVKTPAQPASEAKTVPVNKKADGPEAVDIGDVKADSDKTSITVTEPVTGEEDPTVYEYSLDGGETWQTSPTFEGLEPGTEYEVSVRKAETADRMPSEPVTIKKATVPEDVSEDKIDTTPTSLTINDPDENTKYEVKDEDGNTVAKVTVDKDGNIVEPAETADGVKVSQDKDGNIVVDGLEPGEQYSVTAAKTDDDGNVISAPSDATPVYTKAAKPEIKDVTGRSVTVKADPGYEYSIDGGKTWIKPKEGEDTVRFEGLRNNETYDVVSRKEGNDDTVSEPATVKTKPEGRYIPDVDVESSVPDTTVTGVTEALVKAMCTAEEVAHVEDGFDAYLKLVITDIDGSAPAADQTLAEEAITAADPDAEIYKYFDISLFKYFSDKPEDKMQIHDTHGSYLSFTTKIPAEMRNDDPDTERTFYLVRVHDGEASVIASTTGDELSYKSDKFSTYAIGYSDEDLRVADDESADDGDKGSKSGNGKSKGIGTGDDSSLMMWLIMMGVSAGALIAVFGRRKREDEE